jgi:hypothetical protein
MSEARDLMERLAAHFDPQEIEWRIGSVNKAKMQAMALAYVDARLVRSRFNEVCGAFWQSRFRSCGGSLVTCEIGLKIGADWVWRGDGAGEAELREGTREHQKEQQLDMAQKATFSDAFKRAGYTWGVGEYLYSLKPPWVPVEMDFGRMVLAKAAYPQLRDYLASAARQMKTVKPELSQVPRVPMPAIDLNPDTGEVEKPSSLRTGFYPGTTIAKVVQPPELSRSENPKAPQAREAYRRIKKAVDLATEASLIDSIVQINEVDFDLIKSVDERGHDQLRKLIAEKLEELI